MKNRMKRIISTVITAVFITVNTSAVTALDEKEDGIPPAAAYYLADAATGKAMMQYNSGKKLAMASITKIMVMILLAEDLASGKVSWDDTVQASAHASGMTGSVIWLEPNEKMPLSELVKAMVISSANDAAVAIAEYLSGSEEDFVKRMNKRASELGMRNTNFTNAAGFDDTEHYTTAKDAAIMTAELFKYDYYNEFMTTRLSSVRTGTERETQLLNTNKLASSYSGIIGGKTGTTDKAGYCVAECAEREGFRLISVVLGADSDEDRIKLSEFLLDSGYMDFQIFTPSDDVLKLEPLKVNGGTSKTTGVEFLKKPECVIAKGSAGKIRYEYGIPEEIEAPVKKGDIVGNITAYIENEVVFTAEVAATDDVEKLTFFKSFVFLLHSFFKI